MCRRVAKNIILRFGSVDLHLNTFQESDAEGRLVTGPSVVSASSYDSGGVTAADGGSSSSVRIDEGDDVRVACAMIVRKQVNTTLEYGNL